MYKLADISAFERLGAQNSVSGAVFNAGESGGGYSLDRLANDAAEAILKKMPNASEDELRWEAGGAAMVCRELLIENPNGMDEAAIERVTKQFHKLVLDAVSRKYNQKMARGIGKKIADHFKD